MRKDVLKSLLHGLPEKTFDLDECGITKKSVCSCEWLDVYFVSSAGRK